MNQVRELSATVGKAGHNPLFDYRITDRTDKPVRRRGRKFRRVSQYPERHVKAGEGRGVGI
jgi:hypothetical protein